MFWRVSCLTRSVIILEKHSIFPLILLRIGFLEAKVTHAPFAVPSEDLLHFLTCRNDFFRIWNVAAKRDDVFMMAAYALNNAEHLYFGLEYWLGHWNMSVNDWLRRNWLRRNWLRFVFGRANNIGH